LKKTSNEEFKAIVKMNSQKKVYSHEKEVEQDPIKSSINYLLEYEFVRLHDDGDDIKFVPTRLGLACLSSSLSPSEGFELFKELIKARQNFVLECDLHAIYLVTPFSIINEIKEMDWHHFEDLYDKLPNMMKRVGEMVGISAQFLIKAIRGRDVGDEYHMLRIHKR
jgi:DNA polymerase theta